MTDSTVQQFTVDAREWLSGNAEDAPRDYGAILPPDLADEARRWQSKLFDAGYAGIHWPTIVGGRGLSPAHHTAWITECALAQVPAFLNMVGIVLAGGSLLAFGTPAQQAEHLRPIITGERIWCQLFSEPGAGSDLAGLTTSAVRTGDRFVLNGQKVWCSNGRVADWGILMARTDPDAPSHRGISFFVLDMSLPGVEARPLRQMNGASEFDEVFLTDVELPADCLLGPLHDGWMVGMATLTNERGHIGAAGISLNRRLDALVGAGSEAGHLGRGGVGRDVVGRDVVGRDVVGRDALAQLWIRGKALSMMGQRHGPVASVLGSLAKLGTTELLFDVAMHLATTQGAAALLDGPATSSLLTAPGARIAGGTSQIQRTLIGERILGLPREPRG